MLRLLECVCKRLDDPTICATQYTEYIDNANNNHNCWTSILDFSDRNHNMKLSNTSAFARFYYTKPNRLYAIDLFSLIP